MFKKVNILVAVYRTTIKFSSCIGKIEICRWRRNDSGIITEGVTEGVFVYRKVSNLVITNILTTILFRLIAFWETVKNSLYGGRYIRHIKDNLDLKVILLQLSYNNHHSPLPPNVLFRERVK